MYYRNIQFNNLFKKYKNPDSSPVTESWERNARDCIAKLRKIDGKTSEIQQINVIEIGN